MITVSKLRLKIADEFRDLIDRNDISQTLLAQLINSNPRTIRRWLSGERSVPETVSILMFMLDDGTISVDDIDKVIMKIMKKKRHNNK